VSHGQIAKLLQPHIFSEQADRLKVLFQAVFGNTNEWLLLIHARIVSRLASGIRRTKVALRKNSSGLERTSPDNFRRLYQIYHLLTLVNLHAT
jgi:hypothetical protein